MTRILPMGPMAVLVEDPPGGPAAWAAGIESPLVVEVVPAARTVLVRCVDAASLQPMIEMLSDVTPRHLDGEGTTVEISTRYDGPDLAEVAAATGVAVDEVIDLHSSTTYTVAFCGFAPGFAYLDGLPARLHLPRRATPRTRVPAGSVAIAAAYSAVYPRSSPGGWHLIGITDEMLFDPGRSEPALLRPGMSVRFVPC